MGLVVLGSFLAWMTWQFVGSLWPGRVERHPDDPDSRPQYQILDFSQDWVSGRNLWNGKRIYGDHQQAFREYLELEGATPPRGVRAGKDPNIRSSIQVNAHPPSSVVLVAPFAWMDYSNAFLAWNLVSLGLFVLVLGLVVRLLGLQVTPLGLLAMFTFMLLCDPFRQQINQGQFNCILLALITGAWAAERTERPILAGALIGVATVIKLFPGFLLAYYAARGRWRVVLAGVISLAACTALTVLVVGVDAYSAYYIEVLPRLARYHDGWLNASLSGFFAKLFDAPSGPVVPVVHSPTLRWSATVLSVTALCAVLLATVRRSRLREEHDLTFGLALVVMLLVSPITWNHAFLLLLVPLALLWARLGRIGVWQGLLLVSLVALCLPAKLVHYLGGFGVVHYRGGFATENFRRPATPSQVLAVLSWQCYALLGLFTILLVALRRERSNQLGPRELARADGWRITLIPRPFKGPASVCPKSDGISAEESLAQQLHEDAKEESTPPLSWRDHHVSADSPTG
jgi:hypothetical protein